MKFLNQVFRKIISLNKNGWIFNCRKISYLTYNNIPKHIKDELLNFQEVKLKEFDYLSSLVCSGDLNNKDALKKYNLLLPLVEILNDIELINVDVKCLEDPLIEDGAELEMANLIEIEKKQLTIRLDSLYSKLIKYILPQNELDNVSEVSLEILSGAGGQEAMLFGEELLVCYEKFAITKNWLFEKIFLQSSEIGGIRSCKYIVSGENVYNFLKYESGIHRVQRVPITSSLGKIHTSTVAVVVLPIERDKEIIIKDSDIKCDTFKSSGPGGQGVNKTDSCVRLTHIPTHTVVTCQRERLQQTNKKIAMEQLIEILHEKYYEEKQHQINVNRKISIGTRSRSDKIRTYNYQQDRITEHRINKNFSNIHNVLGQGNLDSIISSLREFDLCDQLEAALKCSENCKKFG